MKQLAGFVVKFRKVFAALFLAMILFSVVSISWVKVENDITVYLPESSVAKQGLSVMDEEFVTYASASVMLKDVSLAEAQEFEQTLSDIDGVLMVDFDDTQSHYKDACALYQITFAGSAENETAIQAMADVRAAAENLDCDIYSSSFDDYAEILSTEMAGVLVICVIVVLVVLVLTSTTYAEIFAFLGTFLAAAVINMGTNFLLGTISFVSNSVAIVMQLALSIDYAIIFCNRYKEEHENKPTIDAVRDALTYSIPAISASSLTTMAGLTAMTFMKFRLGFDLGISLIKAILFSLLSVFFFMPFLLVAFGKLMDKTRHRSFIPKISAVGRFAYRTRFVISPILLALVILGYFGYSNVNYAYNRALVPIASPSESSIAYNEITDTFGSSNLVALLVPSGDRASESALIDELEQLEHVKSVRGVAGIEAMDGYTLADEVTYADIMDLADIDETTAQALFAYYAAGHSEYQTAMENLENYHVPILELFLTIHDAAENGTVELEDSQQELIDSLYSQLAMVQDQLEGEHFSCIAVTTDLPVQGEETFDFLNQIYAMAGEKYDDPVYMTGDSVSAMDFCTTFEQDTRTVSILSIVLVMLILLFTFRSVGMPIILILVIQGSIWLNFATSAVSGSYVFFMTYLIVSSIQMGANIDYAIVISTRYTEFRNSGTDRKNAIMETLNLAFPTIITSGTIMVAAGLMIGFRVSEPIIAGMGQYVGTGTIISLILVNFALPQLLVFGDGFVRATTLKHALMSGVGISASMRKRLGAIMLTAAAVFALIAVPFTAARAVDTQKSAYYRQQLDTVQLLESIAVQAEADASDYDTAKYEFAEHLVTDIVGSAKLASGEAEYESGRAELDDAKEQLASGEAEYASGDAEYQSGLADYQASQQKLADGQAAYDEGKAEYEAGKAKYEASLAEYNAGKEQLAEAKEQYAEAESQLSSVSALYDAVAPYYQQYVELQQEYDTAEANGDTVTVLRLSGQLTIYKALYETQLGSSGYSVAGLMQAYESAQAELADAKQQIDAGDARLADAETQLADAQAQLSAAEKELESGKAELEEGYAALDEGKQQLTDAHQQLADARTQLDDGAQQIADGETELADAQQQLEDGRAALAENRQELDDNVQALDDYAQERETLTAGIDALKNAEESRYYLSDEMSDSELCLAAEEYYTAQLSAQRQRTIGIHWLCLLLIAAAAAAAVSVLTTLLHKQKAAVLSATVSGILALSAAVLWMIFRTGLTVLPLIAALCLTAAAGAFLLMIYKAKTV